MAIVDGLTTLAAVKLETGISDTSQDLLLEALINSVSAAVGAFLDRDLKRVTRIGERYAVNNRQNLFLVNYPVQSITSCTLGGVAQIVDEDIFLDASSGRLYRQMGWTGSYFSRGTFPDAFAGAWDILVTYVSGFYLPGEAGYLAGAATSLPMAIGYAVNRAVVTRLRAVLNQADGLKQYSEGGLSMTWFGAEGVKAGNGGFDDVVASMLNPWKRREVMG
jgi:hypothetical protein